MKTPWPSRSCGGSQHLFSSAVIKACETFGAVWHRFLHHTCTHSTHSYHRMPGETTPITPRSSSSEVNRYAVTTTGWFLVLATVVFIQGGLTGSLLR